jgi:hypothetical protein
MVSDYYKKFVGKVYKPLIIIIFMKKNMLLICMIGLMLVLSICFISASVTVVSPGASATLSGTALLNASGVNLMNCTFYAKSSSTANSTWSSLGFFANLTQNANAINGTFNSAGLEDSNDYIFNATCRNQTNSIHDGTRSGITIDNTSPTAPTLSPSTNTLLTSSGTTTFTGTVVNRETTSCTYTIYRDGSSGDSASSSGSGSYSGASCTFTKTFTNSNDNGNYLWTVTASDGTNTTSSSSFTYQVQIPGSGGGLPPSKKAISEKQIPGILFTFILIIIIIVAFILIKVSKK